MSMSVAERRFISELTSLLDTTVSIRTSDGKVITGRLVGFHPDTLSICLWNARIEGQEGVIPKLFLNGSTIAQIWSAEKPFDVIGLAERIARVFGEEHVKVIEDKGIIMVMGRIKVTREGVEGHGPAAERVKRIYDAFIAEMKAKEAEKK